MTVMKKYAVIWCSDASGDLDLQEKMISAFGRENEEWEIF